MNVDTLVSRLSEMSRSGHGEATVYSRGLAVVDLTVLEDGTVALWTSPWRPTIVEEDDPTRDGAAGGLGADEDDVVVDLSDLRDRVLAQLRPPRTFAVAEIGDFVLMEVTRITAEGFRAAWVPGLVTSTNGAGVMTKAKVFDDLQDQWIEAVPIACSYVLAAALVDGERACRELAPSTDKFTLAAGVVAYLTEAGRSVVDSRRADASADAGAGAPA